MFKKKEKNFTKRTAKDYGWKATFFQLHLVTRFLFLPFYKLMYKLKVNGRDNIPKERAVLVAANHASHLDPPLLTAALFKPIAYMAKSELFEIPVLSRLIWELGAFAVKRGGLAPSTIRTAKAVLSHPRWTMALFPQGGRRRTDKIQTITKGFASLAKTTKTDILPVGIVGNQKIARFPLEGDITVNIGTPISYELPTEEIIVEWARQISELSGLKNEYEIVASVSDYKG